MIRCIAAIAAAFYLNLAVAQDTPGEAVPEAIGERLEVSLVTVEPGPYYWQRYGHNALLLEDPISGFSGLYNYGVFDFDRPGFLLDFLRGRMRYRLLTLPADRDIQRYLDDNRVVHIQRLNLDPAQTLRLARFLEWNRLPENAEYRYDYFFDNCSTRVRDALDLALEGQLERSLSQMPAGQTLRQHADRYSSPDWWVHGAVLVALGRPVDQPIDQWVESFIPMVLRDAVDRMQVETSAGTVTLVGERDVIRPDRPVVAPSSPSVWAYWLVGGIGVAVAWLWFGRRRGRWFERVAGVWLFELGVVGVLLTLLWVATDHQGAHRNENILLFSPLMLVAGLAVLRRWKPRLQNGLLLAIGASTGLAVVLKLLPFSQSNLAVLCFAVPANLGLIWALLSRPPDLVVARRQ